MLLWFNIQMAKNICHFTVVIKISEFSGDVKKERINEITNIICALLNTTGGQLDICMDNFSKDAVDKLIRPIEQRFKNIIGGLATSEKILQQLVTPQKVTFLITALGDCLCTLSYYLFLTSACTVKVQTIEPNEPITAIEKILEGRQEACYRVQTQLGTHRRGFTKGEQCGDDLLSPSNVVCKFLKEGRNVKSEITSKQGKFQSQVSALANDSGGHIYHGIKSGKVVGVFVKENENEIIISEVKKALGKLIWAGNDKPKRGTEWDIFFEPVKDENGDIIHQMFVIIVSIVPYKGGVFTAEPDCYHVVRGKVEKMCFSTWKKELLLRRTVRQCNNIDEHVNSIKVPKFIAIDGKTAPDLY